MSTRSPLRARFVGLLLACWLAPAPAAALTAADLEVDPTRLAAAQPPEGDGSQAGAPLPGPDPLFDDDQAFEALEQEIWDPLEGMNRAFFGFNRWVDRLVWKPVTRGYQLVVPEPGRRAVRRFFLNLSSAPIFVNDLLQLRLQDAGETLGRFVLNSTVGMGGLFDAAVEAGWERHHADFGQTLALAGLGRGPYLVLPVLGPTTVRDGFGVIVDRAFEPLTYIFGFGLLGPSIQLMIGAGSGIVTREEYLEELEQLETSSVDFYAAIRSVYVQNREAQIWDTSPPPYAVEPPP